MFEFLYDKRLLLLIALINFAAGIYSLTYYLPQLDVTNILFWIFVADCPVYALFFGLNVLLLIKEKPSPLLSFVSIIGNIKYGLWTIFVYFLIGGIGGFGVYWLFILSHVFLIIETILFARLFSFKLKHVLIAVIWFLFNDFLDYFLGVHPFIPEELVPNVAIFALFCSIILPIFVGIMFSVGSNAYIPGTNPQKQVKKPRWAKRI